jgi:hypothetical protein
MHLNVQVTFQESVQDMYLFTNNVCSAIIEIIWNFYDKFMDPNYVTTSIRRTIGAFYDIIWITTLYIRSVSLNYPYQTVAKLIIYIWISHKFVDTDES